MNLAALCHRCGGEIEATGDRHPLCPRCATDPAAARRRLSLRCHRNRLRAYRRGAPGFVRPADVRRKMREQGRRCATCRTPLGPVHARPPGYHIDHIEALANGGVNTPSNIQLLCPTCNLRKGAA